MIARGLRRWRREQRKPTIFRGVRGSRWKGQTLCLLTPPGSKWQCCHRRACQSPWQSVKQVFNSWKSKGHLPATWVANSDPDYLMDLSQYLYPHFPELWMCKMHWKLDTLVTLLLPSYHQMACQQEHRLEAKPKTVNDIHVNSISKHKCTASIVAKQASPHKRSWSVAVLSHKQVSFYSTLFYSRYYWNYTIKPSPPPFDLDTIAHGEKSSNKEGIIDLSGKAEDLVFSVSVCSFLICLC